MLFFLLFRMGILNVCRCLVTFLILIKLPSFRSSPIPALPDLLKSRSSALPAEEKGQLSQGFLGKRGIQIATEPPATLDSHADSRLQQRRASVNSLNSPKTQGNSDLPKAIAAKQSFMQLRVSQQSTEDGHDLKFTSNRQNSDGLPSSGSEKKSWQILPIKPRREVNSQDEQQNMPSNPAVQPRNQAQNSVLSVPRTQPVVQSDLPLKNGLNLINLGHLDLKPDVCKPYHFKETVRHHGCNSVVLDNNMCYGQCNSFYIPKRFFSCSCCAPSQEETVNVRLECPGQNPAFVVKKVLIVKECGCKDCGQENS